jgi:hypothetical protein
MGLVDGFSTNGHNRQDTGLALSLAATHDFIQAYVVLTGDQSAAATLWAAHTHAVEAADTTLYLQVTSAEKRSGKSRLLEVLSLLASRSWITGRTSAAALYRKVDGGVTLLLDESDAAFKEKEYSETLRGVLNTGWRRGGSATVCVGHGAKIEARDFSTFGPKAIAGIGKLPDTVEDRSIKVILKRRRPDERVKRFRWRQAMEEAEPIRDALSVWGDSSVIEALTSARPDIPGELDDRAADGWEPLFAIADIAGGDWPQRARDAALALSVGDGRDDDSLGVRLLGDIKDTFREQDEERLTTTALVSALTDMDERPWGDLKGKPIDARGLAWRLRIYGIRPKKMRTGITTIRGYERGDFEDAWGRYCPSPPEAEQAEQTADTDTENVPDVPDVPANRGMGEERWKLWPDDDIADPPPPLANGSKPRCVTCGATMSVARVRDRCGRCTAKAMR